MNHIEEKVTSFYKTLENLERQVSALENQNKLLENFKFQIMNEVMSQNQDLLQRISDLEVIIQNNLKNISSVLSDVKELSNNEINKSEARYYNVKIHYDKEILVLKVLLFLAVVLSFLGLFF